MGKAEYLAKGENPRFIVTSIAIEEKQARELYEDFYCARGDMENRIKEQQLCLFADRTSTSWLRSNQLRLYFSSFAYILMHTLRRLGLEGTELAKAQCDTIQLKLFKIGAQIQVTVRKVWISFSESYPYLKLFQQVLPFSKKLQPAVKPRLSAGYLSNLQQGNNYACESDYQLVQSRIAAIGVQWPICRRGNNADCPGSSRVKVSSELAALDIIPL